MARAATPRSAAGVRRRLERLRRGAAWVLATVLALGLAPRGAGRRPAARPRHDQPCGSGGSDPSGHGPVTAVDGSDRLAVFATRSGRIDVAAPGSHIAALTPGGGHAIVSGSSFATPFVAALAARMLAVDPGLTPADVARILRASSRPLRSSTTAAADIRFGVVDVDAALRWAGVVVPTLVPRTARLA